MPITTSPTRLKQRVAIISKSDSLCVIATPFYSTTLTRRSWSTTRASIRAFTPTECEHSQRKQIYICTSQFACELKVVQKGGFRPFRHIDFCFGNILFFSFNLYENLQSWWTYSSCVMTLIKHLTNPFEDETLKKTLIFYFASRTKTC